MRVLVTGHSGYIGSVLVPRLVALGYDVHGLDSDLFAACTFLPEGVASIPSVRRDLRDVTRADLEGFDAVVHLANLSNDPLGNLNPALTYEINHTATVRLGEHARAAGVRRFLFASSCSLYGAAGQHAVTEEAAFHPQTPYGEAKVLAERDLAPLATDTFSPVFLRNATVYGVSPRLRFDLVVNNLTAWAVTTGQILLKSDGTPWRPLVHVEDVCRAVEAVLDAPREAIHNEAFNVGRNGENYQIRQVAEIVGDVVPDCAVAFAGGASPDTRSYQVDFSKIQRHVPSFQPQWTVRRGVEQLFAAFRDAALTPDAFEGPQYRRLKRLEVLLDAGAIDANLRWSTAPVAGAGVAAAPVASG
ncbi:MAG: SDR family oxidoreductase [Bacteroidota bacterium]